MDGQRFLPLFTVALATGAPMVHGCTITIPAGLLPGAGTTVVTASSPSPKPTIDPRANPIQPPVTPPPSAKPTPTAKPTPPLPISNPMVPVVSNPTPSPEPTPPLPISNPMVPIATPTPQLAVNPIAPTPTPGVVMGNGFLPAAPREE